MPVNFVSLNLLFKKDEQVEGVKHFIETGVKPVWATRRFKSNYGQAGDFAVRDNKLIYTGGGRNLVVVPKSRIPELLESIYHAKETGLAKSIGSMYKFIQLHYVNISRQEVAEWMRAQPRYQIQAPEKPRVNKPFVSKAPNSLWSCDLIDMNTVIGGNAARMRYIFTVIDIFSRRCWLGAIKEKSATLVGNKFADIIRRAGVAPSRILSDNGGEFAGKFDEVCRTNKISHSYSRPHQPQSNGVSERLNKEVRRRINALFIQTKNHNWPPHLHTIEQNINSSFHSAIKTSPETLWRPTKGPAEDPTPLEQEAIATAAAQTRKKLEKFKESLFAVGDQVRASMASLFSDTRATIKAGRKKQLAVTYSPQVFTVVQKITPRDGLSRPRYILRTLEGEQLKTSPTVEAQFYGSDLIKATDEIDGFDDDVALRINNNKRTANDVVIG